MLVVGVVADVVSGGGYRSAVVLSLLVRLRGGGGVNETSGIRIVVVFAVGFLQQGKW